MYSAMLNNTLKVDGEGEEDEGETHGVGDPGGMFPHYLLFTIY